MKRIRHSPEQIIRKLREADAELAKGVAVPEICKALGIAENTYYRWRNQFGGIKADEMKRLKELEKENERLRKAVSDLTLEKLILREAASGNFFSIRGPWVNSAF
jgi:putative transposase